MIDDIKLIKDDLYMLKIEGVDEEMCEMSYVMVCSIYGEELFEVVEVCLEKELKSIIGYGFVVIYLILYKFVKKFLNDGYLVGLCGFVGFLFVVMMMEIIEVNLLLLYYVCLKCKKFEFFNDGFVGFGFDLLDKSCDDCGVLFIKDGYDILFEMFLGFKGDKVFDIDLNFFGEY